MFGDEAAEEGFNFTITDNNKEDVAKLLRKTVRYLNMRDRKGDMRDERWERKDRRGKIEEER